MKSSHSRSRARTVRSENKPPFMRLPTELREMIYRYLLIANYTVREHNMRSKEFDDYRGYLQYSPDQTHLFYTAILSTNRRIHEESVDLCRRENDFVCLTSQRPSRLGYELEERGLEIIAQGAKAQDFWNSSMTLTLDPADFGVWPYHMRASKHDRPWNYIFCSDELPTFCRILLELAIANDIILRNTAIYIGINAAIWNGQAAGIDSNLAGLARMRKLLEPLSQLHSFGAAQVEGPLSGSYKGSINASVCKECPTAFDIIETAMEALSQGDEQVSKGRLRQSNQGYKAALNYVRSCFWRYDERDFIMNSGPFPKLEAIQVMANLQVRLQARIASVYLESGKLRMARIYTERALDPRRRYDHRQHKLYYSLDLQPWQKVVYAEVLHVAAKVRYIQGHAGEAEQRLSEAGELVPLNEEQQSRYEAWQTRAVILYDRQTKSMQAKRLLSEKQDEMAEGKFLVACNWKTEGDRLLQSGDTELAAWTYKSALLKTESLRQDRFHHFTIKSGKFENYVAGDAIHALSFKLQACIANTYLIFGNYEEVNERTAAALACTHASRVCPCPLEGHCSHLYRGYGHDWEEDQKLDYVKLHYCKALALKHVGDTLRATEHMAKALGFDLENSTVSKQLTLLKQELEEDEARHRKAVREDRLRKIKAPQVQLRKKQAKRKEKARA